MEDIKKEIMQCIVELSDLLTQYRYDDAYAVAGKLNFLLKDENVQSLPYGVLEPVHNAMKSYYRANEERNTAQKRMIAIGHSLRDVRL